MPSASGGCGSGVGVHCFLLWIVGTGEVSSRGRGGDRGGREGGGGGGRGEGRRKRRREAAQEGVEAGWWIEEALTGCTEMSSWIRASHQFRLWAYLRKMGAAAGVGVGQGKGRCID